VRDQALAIHSTNIVNEIDRHPDHQVFGQVTAIVGMLIEVGGVAGLLAIGDYCAIEGRDGNKVMCEVVGFRGGFALAMPFGSLDGIGLGCRAHIGNSQPVVYPTADWLGRVINAFGEPVDGKGPLPMGEVAYQTHRMPPPAHLRHRVGGKIDLGVRAMNTFLTCCRGQRLGIFAGSGVGKSTLLSMMARHTDADVSVVGLIGERGREAREFVEDDLGEEGLKRSVVIVATSDEPPLVRRQAAHMTMTMAEYFRDKGTDVLCLMDSVTRFAMAQREISLSAGEPPASKGYTPSVFSELPKLLERAGPGVGEQGSITGLFTVLVEGDDHNEPVSDAVRGILDGHVVLDRAIAERGRYPPVNILRSLSRSMPDCNSAEENALVTRAKKLTSVYEDMAELIRLGAYRRGSDPQVDEAIHYYPMLDEFMDQRKEDHTDLPSCYRVLGEILGMEHGQGDDPAAPAGSAPAGASQPDQPGAQSVAQRANPAVEMKPLTAAPAPPAPVPPAPALPAPAPAGHGNMPPPQFGSPPPAPPVPPPPEGAPEAEAAVSPPPDPTRFAISLPPIQPAPENAAPPPDNGAKDS
jgi:flagellum-specific ATP synthase